MPSLSKSQQKLFGIAYSVKKGETEIENLSITLQDKIKPLLKMSLKDLKDFASTDTEDLPKHVKKYEDFEP